MTLITLLEMHFHIPINPPPSLTHGTQREFVVLVLYRLLYNTLETLFALQPEYKSIQVVQISFEIGPKTTNSRCVTMS